MNKALILLLAISAHGVAGEVGASNPQTTNLGDSGASSNIAAQPYVSVATDELRDIEMKLAKFDDHLNVELTSLTSENLDVVVQRTLDSFIAENVDPKPADAGNRLLLTSGHF